MTVSELPLLCRSPLWPGESLPSLLARLTEANHYVHSVEQVVMLCQERLAASDTVLYPAKAETYRVLAHLLQLEAEQLYAACAHRFANVLNPPTEAVQFVCLPAGQTRPLLSQRFLQEQLWPASNIQFCPLCLQQALYHRVAWLPLTSVVCLQHHCLLVRGCPTCQTPLHVRQLLKNQCPECDFELTAAPVICVASDAFGLLSQQLIQSWLSLAPVPDISVPTQTPATLYRFVDGLRRAMMKLDRSWPYLHQFPGQADALFWPAPLKRHMTPIRAYLFYATACKALLDWPQGFYDFLDAYHHRDERASQTPLPTGLGGLYAAWMQRWSPPAFQFVQDAFDQYLLDNYTRTPSLVSLHRVRANPPLRRRFPYLTLAEAAQRLGTTVDMVTRLMQANFLVSYQQAEGDVRSQQVRLISQVSVQSLQHQWQGNVPMSAAAQLLGTSKQVVFELIEAGLLEASPPHAHEDPLTRTLSYQALTHFITKLHRRIFRQYTVSTTATFGISLASATQMLAPCGFNQAAVVELIFTGELRGHWPKRENRLSRVEISLQDVAMFIDNYQTSRSRLTHRQVANMMYVSSAVVSNWIASGLLCPIDQHGHTKYFDRETVFRFVQSHLFLDDATKLLGLEKAETLKWVNRGHLHPVSGPGVDSLPDYLFRRDDVDQFKQSLR